MLSPAKPLEQRTHEKNEFLNSFFQHIRFTLSPLPLDASFRSYERIHTDKTSYIFMNCPPEYYSLLPFIDIANFLREHHFSSPEIYAYDVQSGLMILEDFGKINFATASVTSQSQAYQFYKLAIDLLNHLHKINSLPPLPLYDDPFLLSEVEIFFDWYFLKNFNHHNPHDLENLKSEFLHIWQELLDMRPKFKNVIVLRDYHAENLMILNDRADIRMIGLLDFQDARIGSPLYDLASLIQDCRFPISTELYKLVFEHFCLAHQHLERDNIIFEYHLLATQRHMKILGIFARKAARDGAMQYLKYIPQTLDFLKYNLQHPKLNSLKKWLEQQKVI